MMWLIKLLIKTVKVDKKNHTYTNKNSNISASHPESLINRRKVEKKLKTRSNPENILEYIIKKVDIS